MIRRSFLAITISAEVLFIPLPMRSHIVAVHDPVLSYGRDSGIVEDLPKQAPSPFRYPPLAFSFPGAYLVEVKAGEFHDLRLGLELREVSYLSDKPCHGDGPQTFH